MADKFEATSEYCIVTCSACGVHFGMLADYQERRRKDHKSFYCPNGHSQYYPGQSKEEKLKAELKQTQVRLDDQIACCQRSVEEIRSLEHSRRALRAHLTRLRNKQHNPAAPAAAIDPAPADEEAQKE
jgi:hypothetical protein